MTTCTSRCHHACWMDWKSQISFGWIMWWEWTLISVMCNAFVAVLICLAILRTSHLLFNDHYLWLQLSDTISRYQIDSMLTLSWLSNVWFDVCLVAQSQFTCPINISLRFISIPEALIDVIGSYIIDQARKFNCQLRCHSGPWICFQCNHPCFGNWQEIMIGCAFLMHTWQQGIINLKAMLRLLNSPSYHFISVSANL